ncbi:MAG: M48 family metalloprotease [Lautropia sp.]|nr:M48 family metalloprotease [Lautropia sp.]
MFRHAVLAVGLMLGMVSGGGWAQVERLPDLGSADTAELSGQQERRLGEQVMRELRTSGMVFDDAELSDWLNRFGGRLTGTGPARGRAFEFFPVREDSINAFALPGGHIGVHTGLLAAAGSESELASVLGHEMGHVTQHHIARMLRNQKHANMMAMAGMVLGALAMRGNADAGVGAITLGSDMATRSILGFSRDAEREADRIGLEMMREGGFDVRGAPLFFGRLQQQNRFNESDSTAYLRTHPITGERINDLSLRIQQLKQTPVARPDSIEFRMVRARSRAISADSVEKQNNVQKYFDAELKSEKGAKDPALWFGLANLQHAQHDWAGADRSMDLAERLLGKPHVFIDRLRVANRLQAGKLQDADRLSAEASSRHPNARALVRLRAEVLNASRQWDQSIALLRNQTRTYKGDAELWRLLGEAYLANGEKGMSHMAAAEGYLVLGYLQPAIQQLRFARNAGDLDYYNGSIVDAKLKEAEGVWLQEQRESGVPASPGLQAKPSRRTD